ncbi:MAG TPA: hypothetical protein VMY43_09350 [Methanothrix sp.]|jgi:hypothetical protein|nr:hypothetical protein [Methanothrix sp.]
MNWKALMVLMALAAIFMPAAEADSRTIALWNYNVTLDGIGQNITVQPMAVSSDVDSIVRSIRFQGESSLDWGTIYLFDHRAPTSIILEDLLRQIMMPSCKAISADPGTIGDRNGMVAKADARVKHGFGQICYGGAAQISSTGETRIFAIIAHFQNETLNEHLVKTARIEHIA